MLDCLRDTFTQPAPEVLPGVLDPDCYGGCAAMISVSLLSLSPALIVFDILAPPCPRVCVVLHQSLAGIAVASFEFETLN